MRLKFFLTIFIVLSFTAASVSAIHFYFFKGERLRLMETNLEQNFTLLTKTDPLLTKKEFSQRGEKLLSDVIGDDKVNMIVSIYSDQGKILFRNDNAEIFETPDRMASQFQEWETIEKKDFFIMYLTRRDHGRIIRVGMVLNQSLIRWRDLNQRIYIFVGIIIFINMLISFFLTYLLFRPVSVLADKVNLMAEKIESGNFHDLQTWFNIQRKSSGGRDEFGGLITSLDKLAHKITETQSLTQRWSALMAHELKTPMTILRMSIDTLVSRTEAPPELVQNIELELKKLEDIIMDFLEWASAENDGSAPELHAVSPMDRCQKQIELLNRTFPEAEILMDFKHAKEFRIFCLPMHFDQVINNLLTNAVKYGEGKVKVSADEYSISILDNGKGIPDRVLENFGKPFNKYQQKDKSGHGLGLAWVNTLARKYGWLVEIKNTDGTQITITFPQDAV